MEKTAGPKKMSPLMERLTQLFTVWRKEPIITTTAMSIPKAQARAAMDTALRLKELHRYRHPRSPAGPRNLVGPVAAPGAQAHFRQPAPGLFPGLGKFGALEDPGQRHVFFQSQKGEQVEGLKNHPHPVPAETGQFRFFKPCQIQPAQEHLPAAGGFQGADDVQQSALAAAALAGDGHEFPGFNGQGDFPQGLDFFRTPAVYFAYANQFNHGKISDIRLIYGVIGHFRP